MGRAFFLFLVVGWVTGCGGDAQGSKASDAGAGGSEVAGNGAGGNGAGGSSSGNGAGGLAPPPAQGAFWANLKSVSPPPLGKMCPVGATLTFDVPTVDPTTSPSQSLDADTYLQKIIDGEDTAEVTCAVQGKTSYTLEGTIKQGSKSLTIASGTLAADQKGTAQIALRASGNPGFSGALSSPSATCVLDAAASAGSNLQVKPGSIWAHFSCPSVEQVPSDYCAAEGFFVLENCEQ